MKYNFEKPFKHTHNGQEFILDSTDAFASLFRAIVYSETREVFAIRFESYGEILTIKIFHCEGEFLLHSFARAITIGMLQPPVSISITAVMDNSHFTNDIVESLKPIIQDKFITDVIVVQPENHLSLIEQIELQNEN